MTIFVNGKQKRVPRPRTIQGMDEEEFIRNNADPIWLHQHGMWEMLHEQEQEDEDEASRPSGPKKEQNNEKGEPDDDDVPF